MKTLALILSLSVSVAFMTAMPASAQPSPALSAPARTAVSGRALGDTLAARPAISDRAAVDSLLNPSVYAGTSLQFTVESLNMGTLSEDAEPITFRFHFRNTGTDPVAVTKVNTTCGCTVALVEVSGHAFSDVDGLASESHGDGAPVAESEVQTLVGPGEEGTVALTFNPRNRAGTADVRAFVYTSESEERPVARLCLTGEVVETSPWSHFPFKMGALRLKQKEVTFDLADLPARAAGNDGNLSAGDGEPATGRRLSERILCVNSGARPITPGAEGLPPCVSCRFEPAVIEPGEEADLVLTLDTSVYASVSGGNGKAGNGEFNGTAADAGEGGASETAPWARTPSDRFSFVVTGVSARPRPDEIIEVRIIK